MSHWKPLAALLVLLACFLAPTSNGEVMRDEALVLELLNSGEINLSKDVAKAMAAADGIRRIRRIGLEKNGRKIRAAFRDKSVKVKASYRRGLKYTDAYYNEVAAYVIARYLGLDIIPATVLRSIPLAASGLKTTSKPRQGSLQLWIENSRVEYDFATKKLTYPGNLVFRNQQIMEIKVFDCIIGNVDRHAGNLLIDLNQRYDTAAVPDTQQIPYIGKIWAIDHSSAFHSLSRVDSKTCKLDDLRSRPVSLTFMHGMRSWQLIELEEALRSSGLSEKQIDHLHLKALDRRLNDVKQYLDARKQNSDLSDDDFYSSGIWHRVR